MKLKLHAPPRAKLTIGATHVDVPDTGEASVIVDLTEPILGLKIDDITFDANGPISRGAPASPALAVSWHLETSATKVDGTLIVSEAIYERGRLARHLVRDVVAGKVDRPAFVVAPVGERKTIVLLDMEDRDVVVTDRRLARDARGEVTRSRHGRSNTSRCSTTSGGATHRSATSRRRNARGSATGTRDADGEVRVKSRRIRSSATFAQRSGCDDQKLSPLGAEEACRAVRSRRSRSSATQA